MILEYFVDRIYVYDDKIIVTCRYTDNIDDGIHVRLKDISSEFDGFASKSVEVLMLEKLSFRTFVLYQKFPAS